MLITKRTRRVRQPASHSAPAPGVLFAISGAIFNQDAVRDEFLTQAHGSLFAKPGVITHRCIDFTAHAAAGLASTTPELHISKRVVLQVFFLPTSASGSIFSRMNTAGTTSFYAGMWDISKSGTTLIFRYNDGTGSIKTWTVAGVVLGAGVDTSVTFDVFPDAIHCYEFGVLKDTLSWSMPSLGSLTLSSPSVRVGRSSSGNDGFAAFVYLASGLDKGDAKSISANPWQIFKPASKNIWFDSAVGGGGGFKPHWALQRSHIIGAR